MLRKKLSTPLMLLAAATKPGSCTAATRAACMACVVEARAGSAKAADARMARPGPCNDGNNELNFAVLSTRKDSIGINISDHQQWLLMQGFDDKD